MNPSIKPKRALVTGAGARVGQAIAIELARAGFEVAIHYRHSKDGALETLKQCQSQGQAQGQAQGFIVQADLNTMAGVEDLIKSIAEKWDSLDVLVHNASIFEGVPFEEISIDQWDEMMQLHMKTPFRLTQGLLPLLKACDNSALVVHMCDIGAERPVSGYTHYSVSKAGLVMLVKAMAVELAPKIRTMGISPGQVIWPENYSETLRNQLKQRIPMKDVGSPQDVATLVRFLAVEGKYLNGEIIAVDGGLQCRY
jgi:pteridine reductase